MNQNQLRDDTEPRPVDQQQACYALVRRCDVCDKANAIDLDGSTENEQAMQEVDHTVTRMSKAEAQEAWKGAGRCDHKATINLLRRTSPPNTTAPAVDLPRLVRPVGLPPQVWQALMDIRDAQTRLEEDWPRYDESGKKFAVESAAAALRSAHSSIMHYVKEVQDVTA